MQRRHVLSGLAAAGVTLLAGCSSGNGNGGGGNNTTQASGGEAGSDGSETTSTATDSTTAAATTMAQTAQTTATQTPAPTSIATATSIDTQTAVPMTQSPSLPPATSSAIGTTGLGTGMATGSMDIDLSDRKTYTNDTYSYSIEYPTGWSVTESDPASVKFSSSGAPASMRVSVVEDIPSSATLDQAIAKFLSSYKQTAAQDGGKVKIQNRHQVALSNGNSAILLDAQIAIGSVSVRQKFLFTLVNSTVYVAAVTISEPVYTSTVNQESEEILTSLTVSGSS